MKNIVYKLSSYLFRQILSENAATMKSEILLSISKALFVIENIERLEPKGKFEIMTSYKESDGYNTTGHTFWYVINKKEISIYSSHYFSEAFGQSYESHKEQIWPEQYNNETGLTNAINNWINDFKQGINESIDIKENLSKLKLLTK